ncbi:CCA tRNA nucleotidyltransferase [Pacificispira sp.]|uniref:CCA tRNA nucleotidyltransferase n=1 Tax=Pacificispira sp. TaxID=2888761 RepID=UPI003B5197DB
MTGKDAAHTLLQAQPWFSEPEVRRLLDALANASIDVRFVGGCVRDALLGRTATDLDLAVDAPPDTVTDALTGHDIKVVPTGIDHGTVTAVLDGRTVEVTSLRRDVETDGRRAVVRYTKDWREDSLRRDFTVNALYADRDGHLTDFHGGMDDLTAGRLRFIGDPDERIREDYLRILRFFRFHAQLGLQTLDAPGLEACARLKERLRDLSAERVAREMLRLLEAPAPAPYLSAMIDGGFLDYWLPEAADVDILERLCGLDPTPDPLLRLAALCPAGPDGMDAIAARLKLSGRDRDRLTALAAPPSPPADPGAARAIVYRLGPPLARDQALLALARGGAEDWTVLRQVAEGWAPPDFPLSGRDALAAGMSPGPAVGEILRRIEEDWIAGDFELDRDGLLRRLKTMGASDT